MSNVADRPAAAGDLSAVIGEAITLVKSKPWRQSLTVQGALVSAAAGAVVAYGPAVLAHVPGIDAAAAPELAHAVAGVLASVGGLMSLIGRLRLGGLH